MEDSIKKIEARVERILTTCSPEVARKRLEGYMEEFYMSQYIKSALAKLHYEAGDPVSAGKLWYFEQEMTPEIQTCIEAFERSLGNDLEHILRAIIAHHFHSPKYLNPYTKRKMLGLLEELKRKKGHLPKFTQTWYDHLVARRADFMSS